MKLHIVIAYILITESIINLVICETDKIKTHQDAYV
jgi:hypothetical protein